MYSVSWQQQPSPSTCRDSTTGPRPVISSGWSSRVQAHGSSGRFSRCFRGTRLVVAHHDQVCHAVEDDSVIIVRRAGCLRGSQMDETPPAGLQPKSRACGDAPVNRLLFQLPVAFLLLQARGLSEDWGHEGPCMGITPCRASRSPSSRVLAMCRETECTTRAKSTCEVRVHTRLEGGPEHALQSTAAQLRSSQRERLAH